MTNAAQSIPKHSPVTSVPDVPRIGPPAQSPADARRARRLGDPRLVGQRDSLRLQRRDQCAGDAAVLVGVVGVDEPDFGALGEKAVGDQLVHVDGGEPVNGDVERLEDLKATADFSQIHDLVAFRILVESKRDCYAVLGHVHSLWKPKEGRIKDFIANPKLNGYRALHTTVFCKDDHLVEVQIRTHEMQEMAEYGVAMHWHYKDVGDSASSSAKELLSWLRQMKEWQREMHSSTTRDTDFV